MERPYHLHQVGPWLHWARPVVSALSHSHVGHQQVRSQVARSKSAVGGLQEGQARHTAGVGLAFTQSQPVSMQPPAWVQGEAQHWEDGKRRRGTGGEEVQRERWRGIKGVRREEGLDPEAGTVRLQQVWAHNGQRAIEEWEEKKAVRGRSGGKVRKSKVPIDQIIDWIKCSYCDGVTAKKKNNGQIKEQCWFFLSE